MTPLSANLSIGASLHQALGSADVPPALRRTHRLWITPGPADESQWLLHWNAATECYEFPTLADPEALACSAVLRGASGRILPGDFVAGPRPIARLPGNLVSEAAPSSMLLFYSAWPKTPLDPVVLRDVGLEWVSAKDVAMGFTLGGRCVDPALRLVLELTGRHGRSALGRDDSLTVGIVSDRPLPKDDVPVLFDKLHQAIEDLTQEFSGRPLHVMSALAAGTEQLVADVALERRLPLIAPLPVRPELYEQEFSDEAEVEEFRQTLDRANLWYTLVPVPSRGRGAFGPDDYRQARLAAARHIVDRCDVLLTAWNGQSTGRGDLMAETLRYALGGFRRPHERLLIRNVGARRDM